MEDAASLHVMDDRMIGTISSHGNFIRMISFDFSSQAARLYFSKKFLRLMFII
jgi:hypothetical protein